MVQPRLIHPVNVVIQQIDRTATNWDPDFKEPIDEEDVAYQDPVTLKGQVNYMSFEQMVSAPASWVKDSIGRIVFRKKDLTAAGITLDLMDKIISIDGEDVTLFILEARPQGHYQHSTLIFAFFGEKFVGV